MKIPVFVSCPTSLGKTQQASRSLILRELTRQGLEPRALGRSDYPTDLPLREVLVIARHCSGGVILGFEQFRATAGILKRGTPEEQKLKGTASFPTPWNQLEAGILFGLKVPLLVFKEAGVSGGVLDAGVTDVFVHAMPTERISRSNRHALTEVFRKWQARVREHYYAQPL